MADIKFGQYQLHEQIGSGGMATVYRAFQPRMERYVAIKVMSADLVGNDTAVKRFVQEAKLVANLEHPHILPVYDFGNHEDGLYIVMRLLETGSLTDHLDRNEGISIAEAIGITRQVAGALDYAHAQGVIHRDIKPSNILLDSGGQIYLTDFGIAKVLESTQNLTKTGGTLGTPAYMSPEQVQGHAIGPQTDVYSLGIVLYEMVTGQVPFEGDTPYAAAFLHVTEAPTPPRELNPDIPLKLELVILKALEKSPQKRYATCAAFMAELNKVDLSELEPEETVPRPAPAPAPKKAAPVIQSPPPTPPPTPPEAPVSGEAPALNTIRKPGGLLKWLLPAGAVLVVCGALSLAGFFGLPVLFSGLGGTQTPTETPLIFIDLPPDGSVEATELALTAEAGPTETPAGIDHAAMLAESQIAFTAQRDGNREIYLLDLASGELTNLTQNSSEDAHPSWSPDGARIAFQSNRDGDYEIYIMDADGSNVQQVTFSPSADHYPAWSPDGEWLAFQSSRAGHFDIYIIRPDGSDEQRITTDGANDEYPSWSPDSASLALSSTRTGDGDIYTVEIATGVTRQITSFPNTELLPAWSPDGTRIAYQVDPDDNWEIFVYAFDSGANVKVTTHPFDDWAPEWSPDSRSLVYYSYIGGNHEIVILELDTLSVEIVTQNGAHDTFPAWRPYP
jgi:serine/threonine protein kinase/Tol biopolymer transport system component